MKNKIKSRIQKFWKKINDNEIRIAFLAFVVVGFVLFLITLLFDSSISFPGLYDLGLYNNADFWENLIIESHGMVLDLLIIGVFLYWLQKRANRRIQKELTLNRYLEELDDYRGWTDNEAAFRVAGIIKRLYSLEHSEINLDNLNLSCCSKEIILKAFSQSNCKILSINDVDLSNTNLNNRLLNNTSLFKSNLNGSDLSNSQMINAIFENSLLAKTNFEGCWALDANFKNAYLRGTNFSNSNLARADFSEAFIRNVRFNGATLSGVNLKYAKVNRPDWIQMLKELNINGASEIERKYEIGTEKFKDELGLEFYFVLPRNQKMDENDIVTYKKSYE